MANNVAKRFLSKSYERAWRDGWRDGYHYDHDIQGHTEEIAWSRRVIEERLKVEGVDVRITCPNCEGRGDFGGALLCGICRGTKKITVRRLLQEKS